MRMGRPVTVNGETILRFRVSEKLHREVRRVARRQGVKMSELLRGFVEELVRKA
jgi:antitoxin component of RelBE/YafQ-DinJ toxin-antitoxin module